MTHNLFLDDERDPPNDEDTVGIALMIFFTMVWVGLFVSVVICGMIGAQNVVMISLVTALALISAALSIVLFALPGGFG